MTPDRGSRLFHAIVGLGLAAGCGGDVTTAPDDGGRDTKVTHVPDASAPEAARESGARDAAQERTSVADVGTPPGVDASVPVDAPAMTIDADMARDAAHDVTIPPPPEIK